MIDREIARAEAHGVRLGRQMGYEVGYSKGWNEAIAADKPYFVDLRHKVAELHAQLADCQRQISDTSYGFNSLHLIAQAAIETLEIADPSEHRAFLVHYNKVAADARIRGRPQLRAEPLADPYIKAYAGTMLTKIFRWIQELTESHEARKATTDTGTDREEHLHAID